MSSSWSAEIESQAPAPLLFKAMFIDWHALGPKLVPDDISSIIILSGFGNEVGDIMQINFTPDGPFSYIKERIDFIDQEKLELKISVVEGGKLGKKLESVSTFFKVEPKGNGSVVKLESTFEAIPGNDVSDDFQKAKEGFTRSVKAVEEYLLANPST